MEVVFVKTEELSNFDYSNTLFKNKKVLNSFNKLEELMICEPVASKEFEVKDMLFPEEISADLFLSYPLEVVVKQPITFKSLYELISKIRETYKEIYKEERKTHKFGIWGHSIYDLFIEGISIMEGKDNPIVRVYIGS
jgi:hypothetical protein